MEHTGRITKSLPINFPKQIFSLVPLTQKHQGFDNDSLRKVKTDKADSVKIARYAP